MEPREIKLTYSISGSFTDELGRSIVCEETLCILLGLPLDTVKVHLRYCNQPLPDAWVFAIRYNPKLGAYKVFTLLDLDTGFYTLPAFDALARDYLGPHLSAEHPWGLFWIEVLSYSTGRI